MRDEAAQGRVVQYGATATAGGSWFRKDIPWLEIFLSRPHRAPQHERLGRPHQVDGAMGVGEAQRGVSIGRVGDGRGWGSDLPSPAMARANFTPASRRKLAGLRVSGGPGRASFFSHVSGAPRLAVKMTGIRAAASSAAYYLVSQPSRQQLCSAREYVGGDTTRRVFGLVEAHQIGRMPAMEDYLDVREIPL